VDKFFVKKQVARPLTLEQVFSKIKSLATIRGQDSVNEKERILSGLLRSAAPEEAKYIIR
jgi:ATP-dependent DNA ligase